MDHSLDIRPINKYKSQSNDSHSSSTKEFREVDFGKDPQNLQDEYLDVYKGIQSDIVSSNRFNENSDISTTYLLEGYFLQNRIIFDSVDKLSPVSNMAYSCLKKC